MSALTLKNQWVRSKDGWVAGVCQGLGESLDINPAMIRLVWAMSILFFGVGLLFYFVCAFCLPVEGQEHLAYEPKFLGVCSRIAQKLDIDVGLTRVLTVIIGLGSLGTTILAYLLIHLILPTVEEK